MAIGTTFLKDGGHATGKIKLSKDQLPEHYHDLSNHTHSNTHNHSITDPGHTHNINNFPYTTDSLSASKYYCCSANRKTISTETAYTGITIDNYTGSTGGPSVNYTGKNYASEMKNSDIDIMPPYEVAYCWKRTK